MTNRPVAIHAGDANSGFDAANPRDRVPVWDRVVRAFHWSLVAAVIVALATGFLESGSLLNVHLVAGALVATLVALRVIWGFTGTTYARFASFLVSPTAVMRHVIGICRGEAVPHVGHNPIGGWMILGLLATLTLLTVTGALVLGGTLKDGPLAPFVTFASGAAAKEMHEVLAFVLLGLISLHVLGITVESLRTRENLVAAMVRGWKARRVNAHSAAPKHARPLLAASLAGATLLAALAGITRLSQLPVPGLPSHPLDPVYAKECGSCHSAHHPSLASSATWGVVMRGLDSHFGENASLDESLSRALATYLAANSAEHWDTLAANRLVKPDIREPLRITSTEGWRRLHRHLPLEVFQRKNIGGRLNCSRCHRDAEAGRFDPRAISIPEEKATP